jgi:hypothetical protein
MVILLVSSPIMFGIHHGAMSNAMFVLVEASSCS